MKRKLIDYINAEAGCNYSDVIDYFTEINNLGCDKIKGDALAKLVWFIYCIEDMNDQEFEETFK